MDDRKLDIKQGAGLEEARVNQEFVDFLRKWSVPALWLVVAVSGAAWGWQWWQRQQDAKVNGAFAALASNVENVDSPSPAALRALAAEHEGVGSVSLLARLRLGDVYLAAVRRGLAAGAEVTRDGKPVLETDVLDEAGRTQYLDDAAAQYRAVLEQTKADPARALIALNAVFGLAAVAECRGEFDEAARQYDEAAALATASGLVGLDVVANERKSSLESLKSLPPVLETEALPVLPGENRAPAGAAVEPTEATPVESVPVEPAAVEPVPAEPVPAEAVPVEPVPPGKV